MVPRVCCNNAITLREVDVHKHFTVFFASIKKTDTVQEECVEMVVVIEKGRGKWQNDFWVSSQQERTLSVLANSVQSCQ